MSFGVTPLSLPQPWHALIHCPMSLFLTFHIHGITPYVGLSTLASFTQSGVFRARPSVSTPRESWTTSHGEVRLHSLTRSPAGGHVGCWHFLAIVDSAAVNVRKRISVAIFICLGQIAGRVTRFVCV